MKYNYKLADKFWSDRAKNNDPLSAVLNIGLPNYANSSFDLWFQRLLLKWVRKDLKILDVGCGVGRVLVPLAKKGCEVTGVDISKEMIKTCRTRVRKEHLENKVRLMVTSADQLPFQSQSFDLVILSEVLFHIPDPLLSKVVRESTRVVRKGGNVIVTANNKESIFLKEVARYDSQRNDGYFFTVRGLKEINKEFEKSSSSLVFKKGLPFTSILNNLKNGKSNLARSYKKWMFEHQRIFKLLYSLSTHIDSTAKIKIFDNKLAGIFFLVYTKN